MKCCMIILSSPIHEFDWQNSLLEGHVISIKNVIIFHCDFAAMGQMLRQCDNSLKCVIFLIMYFHRLILSFITNFDLDLIDNKHICNS